MFFRAFLIEMGSWKNYSLDVGGNLPIGADILSIGWHILPIQSDNLPMKCRNLPFVHFMEK